MTLIAGFRCSDGFVIAADTEVTYGVVSAQGHKLVTSSNEHGDHRLIIAVAGDPGYGFMAAQEIRDEVAATGSPKLRDIKKIIRAALRETYDNHILPVWRSTGLQEPSLSLIVGAEDADGECAVFHTDRNSVYAVSHSVFDGSGRDVAAYFAEKVFDTKSLSTAITQHFVQQLFREMKGKGIYVGGNTEIISRHSGKAESFFRIESMDTERRAMWGLEDMLWTALRVALSERYNAFPGEEISRQLQKCIEDLRAALVKLYTDRHAGVVISEPEIYVAEFPTGIGHPLKN